MQEQNTGKETYAWVAGGPKLCCRKSKDATQTLTKFWEVEELTAFHDAELAQATKEINAILNEIEKGNKDSRRKLSFIQFRNQHFLVWAEYRVGSQDDEETIRKTLRLKSE
jgi:hypothetical protein